MMSRTMPILVGVFVVTSILALFIMYMLSPSRQLGVAKAVPTASAAKVAATASPTNQPTATPTPGPLTGFTSVDKDLQAMDATVQGDSLSSLSDSTLSDSALTVK
jgi:hypothetical protein